MLSDAQSIMCPVSDLDPFSIDFLSDSERYHRELRELGAVVRLSRYGIYVFTRHAEVHAALLDGAIFCSSRGIGLADFKKETPWRPPSVINEVDAPEHARTRGILARVLSRPALEKLRASFAASAALVVDEALALGELDGIKDFSEKFPLRVIPDAVGLLPEGRENLLPYGDLVFNSMGPRNALYEQSRKNAEKVVGWIVHQCRRESLSSTGFGARIYEEADSGIITEEEAGMLVRSILSAGLDTTIFGLGHMLRGLAANPEQWQTLRQNPALMRAAWDEAVRYGSTVQAIFRTTTQEVDVAGVRIGEGEKILLLLASANRDPLKFENPDRFDITRKVAGHVGFGFGSHMCVGQMLSRLEADVILAELIEKVERIEAIGEPVWRLNNTLRGLGSLPLRMTAA
ncbi:MAG: cytochrome P450 [Janthinobacterium lividum]